MSTSYFTSIEAHRTASGLTWKVRCSCGWCQSAIWEMRHAELIGAAHLKSHTGEAPSFRRGTAQP